MLAFAFMRRIRKDWIAAHNLIIVVTAYPVPKDYFSILLQDFAKIERSKAAWSRPIVDVLSVLQVLNN
jgi:hypothetical protein